MSDLKVATILPVPFLEWERGADYHMCLAHLMHVPEYGQFFARMSNQGRFVLMDNGVVETGLPLPFEELLHIARAFDVTQMTLPDRIRDARATLELHEEAATGVRGRHPTFMAIPQGRNIGEWVSCCQTIIEAAPDWGVRAVGVTKFLEGMVAQRSDAILAAGLLDSGLDIHLLGTLGDDPTEIFRTNAACKGVIRGADSGMAAIWTQVGQVVGRDPRPKVELDFLTHGNMPDVYDDRLLRANIRRWKSATTEGHT